MSGATRSAVAPAAWRRLWAPPISPHSRRASVVRRKLLLADLARPHGGVHPSPAHGRLETAPGSDRVSVDSELLLFAASLPLWVVLARAFGLYSRDEERPEHTTVDDFVGVFQLLTTCVWLIFVVAAVTNAASPDLEKWIIFWFLAFVFVSSGRSLARLLARRSRDYSQKAVVVGTDKTAQLMARKIVQHPEFHIDLVGFVDASPRKLRSDVAQVPIVGSADELIELSERLDLDRVVIGFAGSARSTIDGACAHAASAGRPDRHHPAPLRGARSEHEHELVRGRSARERAPDEHEP